LTSWINGHGQRWKDHSADRNPQVLNAAEYYLPLFFQSTKLASPLRSGVLLLPLILTEALVAMAAGLIIHRTGRYIELIYLGAILMTLGQGLYVSLNANTSSTSVTAFQVVSGIGIGMLFEPPLIALQALVRQEDTATATATLGLMRGLGVALSTVIGSVIFQNGMAGMQEDLRAKGLADNLLRKFNGEQAASNLDLIAGIEDERLQLAVKEAFAYSLRNLWILCVALSAAAILVSCLVSKKELAREHIETKTGIAAEKREVRGEEESQGPRAASTADFAG
jgi:MFS family permease